MGEAADGGFDSTLRKQPVGGAKLATSTFNYFMSIKRGKITQTHRRSEFELNFYVFTVKFKSAK